MSGRVISFTGVNGGGEINVPGTQAGDEIVTVIDSYDGSLANGGIFFPFVAVSGQIRQISGLDLSTHTYYALLK